MRRVNKLWKWMRPCKMSLNSYLTLYQLHNIRGLSHPMSQDGSKTPQGLRNHSLSECSSDQLLSYVVWVHLPTAVEPIEQAAWLGPWAHDKLREEESGSRRLKTNFRLSRRGSGILVQIDLKRCSCPIRLPWLIRFNDPNSTFLASLLKWRSDVAFSRPTVLTRCSWIEVALCLAFPNEKTIAR